MSLLGFTFGFGAKDEGLDAALKSTTSNAEKLFSSMEDGGKDAGDALKDTTKNADDLFDSMVDGSKKAEGAASELWQALQSIQLGTIQGDLEKVLSDTGSLSTSLETTFAGYVQATKPIVAQLGLTGKAASKANAKIAGLAYSTGIGADQVGQAFAAMKMTAKGTEGVLEEMGLTLADLAKAEVTTGVSTRELLDNVADLTLSWGFSDKQAAELVDTYTKVAQSANLGGVAFKSFGSNAEAINEILSQTGKAVSPEDIAKAQIGLAKLGGAFADLGETPENATAAALTFFKAITGEVVNQEKMLSGLGGEYGEFFTGLVKEAGFKSVEDMFQLDPAEAVKQLTILEDQFKALGDGGKEQLNRFHKNLASINPQLSFLVQNSGSTRASLERLSKVAGEDAAGAFKKMGKDGFSTGRTLQDSYEMLEASFELRIRKMGGSMGKYVSWQRKAMKQVGNDVKELSESPAWGALTKAMVRMSSGAGLAGMLMPATKAADVYRKKVDEVTGEVEFYRKRTKDATEASYKFFLMQRRLDQSGGGLAARFEAIKSAGIAGFFLDLEDTTKPLALRMAEAEHETEGLAGKMLILQRVMTGVLPIVSKAITLLAGLTVIMKPLMPVIKAILKPFKMLGGAFKNLAKSMAKSPIKTMANGFKKMGKPIGKVRKALNALWRIFGGTKGLIRTVATFVAGIIGWPATIAVAVAAAAALIWGFKDEIAAAFSKAFDWIGGTADRIAEWFDSLDGATMAKNLIQSVKDGLKSAWGSVKAGLQWLWGKIVGFFSGGESPEKLASGVKSSFDKMLGSLGNMGDAIKKFVTDFFGEIAKEFQAVDWAKLGDDIISGLTIAWEAVTAWWRWEALPRITAVEEWFKGADSGEAGSAIGTTLKTAFTEAVNWMKTELGPMLLKGLYAAYDMMTAGLNFGSDILGKLTKAISEFDFSGKVQGWFDKLVPAIEGGLEWLRTEGVKKIKDFFAGLFGAESATAAAESAGKFDWSKVVDMFKALGGFAMKVGGFLLNLMWEALKVLGTLIVNIVPLMFEVLWTLFSMVWDLLYQPVIDLFLGIWKTIGDKISEKFDSLKKTVTEKFGAIKEWFTGVKDNLVAALFGPEGAFSPIMELGDKALQAGRDFVDMLWQGISEKWEDFKGNFTGAMDWIREKLPANSPAEDGPLAEGGGLRNDGSNMFEELNIGMKAYFPTLDMSFSNKLRILANNGMLAFKEQLIANLPDVFGGLDTAISEKMDLAASSVVVSFVDRAYEQAVAKTKRLPNVLANVMENMILQASTDVGGDVTTEVGALVVNDSNTKAILVTLRAEGEKTRKVLRQIDNTIGSSSMTTASGSPGLNVTSLGTAGS
jgi:hypothetical protein